MSFTALLWADYRALYGRKRPGVREPATKAMILMLPRVAADANLHANVLVRATVAAPPRLRPALRRLLRRAHGMDVDHRARIGPGLFLPHPLGITIGPDVRLGQGVALFHNTTVKGAALGDRVKVFTGAAVLGPCTVGDDAIVGAGTTVTTDVPAGGRAVRGHGAPDGGPALLAGPAAPAGGAGGSLRDLLVADHRARFGPGPVRPRALRDRGFRAVVAVRLMHAGPDPLWRLWRRVLLSHGCDVGRDARIGPGLAIPRPHGVVVGRRAQLGRGVVLEERATVTPTRTTWSEADGLVIGDGVRVGAGAGVFGALRIASGTTIAPGAIVTRADPEPAFTEPPPGSHPLATA